VIIIGKYGLTGITLKTTGFFFLLYVLPQQRNYYFGKLFYNPSEEICLNVK
jgi:hypothetical protein